MFDMTTSGGSAKRSDGTSMTYLWSWLVKRRWQIRADKNGVSLTRLTEGRFSWWALLWIFLVTKTWSGLINELFSESDSVRYYHFLKDGSWVHQFHFQPMMFWVMALIHPTTFPSYLLISSSIPLLIILYSFYRLHYTKTEQFLLIFFFTCSFYGTHFVVTFQRQFYAFALFMLAISGTRGSWLSRAASLLSHIYAFILHIFWEVGKLRPITAAVVIAIILPVIMLGARLFDGNAFTTYASAAQTSMSALVIKEGMNLVYTGIVFYTLRRDATAIRSLCTSFAVCAVPSLVSTAYAGVFARVDYYLFPFIIAMWPIGLDPAYKNIFKMTIVLSTIAGFTLWMYLNFTWIAVGIPSSFSIKQK